LRVYASYKPPPLIEALMKFELFVGRRYFQSKPGQAIIALITALSILGVIIGVTALIVVIGVMAGFESDLKRRIMGIEPHLIIDRDGKPITESDLITKLGEQIQGVNAIWPVVEFHAIAQSDARVAIATIKGVAPEAASAGLQMPNLAVLNQSHEMTAKERRTTPLPPLVMGSELARSLGIIRGDTVFVISPRGTLTPVGFVPYKKRFRVADFFQTGMYEYDGSLIFMNLKDAQSLARIRDTVSAVELRVDNMFKIQSITAKFKSIFNADYRFRDWRQLNKNLFSALKLEKTAMFIILTLIILVATFSIASALVMLVIEKTKDIAILKTMGATNGAVRRIFILQGLLIGIIGTTIGVGFGTLLCYLQNTYQWIRLPDDVFYIAALPVDLHAMDVALVAVAAMIICFLATLYPAHQASRFNPVEALRYG